MLERLKTERLSWWNHWREIDEYIFPRQYNWLRTPGETNRGTPRNHRVLDPLPFKAAENLASGFMEGSMSQSKPWFTLEVPDFDLQPDTEEAAWLKNAASSIYKIMARSNFYTVMSQTMMNIGLFGSGGALIEEIDGPNLIHCYPQHMGEFYWMIDHRGIVVGVFRELIMTVDMIDGRFERQNMLQSTRVLAEQGGQTARQEVRVRHAIMRNDGSVPGNMPWASWYWEEAQSGTNIWLERKGYSEWPAVCGRWRTIGQDAYGTGPGMDMLPEVKQLYQAILRKGQILDKMGNPPMLADASLRNEPNPLIPGRITYVASLNNNPNGGMREAHAAWRHPLAEVSAEIERLQENIRAINFNDLFLMISQLDTVRSATEIIEKRNEKLQMLGPFLKRHDTEVKDAAINRIFGIAARRGIIPPPPDSLRDQEIRPAYTSMMTEAQEAASTVSMERVLATAGNLAALPQAQPMLDKINFTGSIVEYGRLLNAPSAMFNTDEQMQALAEERRAKEQNAEMMQAAEVLPAAAKNLSETDVGGGQNALSMIAGGLQE